MPGEHAQALEARLEYKFEDRDLLLTALTHPSCSLQASQSHNQRLEFLGDAVLGMVVAEALFEAFPEEREGVLTRQRSRLVNGEQLSTLAREIELGTYLLMSEAEEANSGRERPSILEDAFEALVGALYLDGGLPCVRRVVMQLLGSLPERLAVAKEAYNPKGRLQEHLQPTLGNEAIEYRLKEASGPDHRKHFTVEVYIDGTCHGTGSGESKKLAEEEAAKEALQRLQVDA